MKKLEQTSPALINIDMINDFNFSHGKILAKKALEISGPLISMNNICRPFI
ncbi:hypothetical protein GCM10009865_54530 [Aeromicrobium ponti]|uniref:Uncharacterized protein n=1 Tax=Cytobacillus oceanisediminis TaxID=665099 RepID=A0A562J308_9BACI|nr:hypothetical protein [Cytobacillus oceanisediminis]TWH77671.1 hypothetical protein IQ19_05624 [Cytobacillus oceanisediminis]